MSTIDDFLKNFDCKEFHNIDYMTDIGIKINDCLISALSHYTIGEIREVIEFDDSKHYVFRLDGGDNGNGNWGKYLEDLRKVVVELEEKFEKSWIVEMKNDCADDVHYVFVGVKNEVFK